MTRRLRILAGAGAALALVLGHTARADGQAETVPLSEYLAAQGTIVLTTPPVADYWGWTAPPPGVKTPTDSYVGGNAGVCDYANIAGSWLVANGGPNLGTTVTGSVTRRHLPDGRILVSVHTLTKNALSFGLRIQTPDFGDFATDPLVFGARPVDVLNGATPGLGECQAAFEWKQTDGPLIDFCHGFDVDPGFEIVSLSFRGNARGPLTATAGLGPDGTPGMMVISESGFARTTFKGATADAFPAEYVEFRRVGR